MRGSIPDKSLLIFSCAIFGALLLPALFMDGMFHDGTFYASISRNLAEGNGTAWNLVFSETYYKEMHEQPPLMFVLQSLFFKVLGNGLYTERIYCLVTAIITTIVLARSWKLTSELRGDQQSNQTNWLPLLLWFIMPVTFYVFTNNMVECTMTIFVMLAFNSVVRALLTRPETHLHWLIAGCWILLAGLTKGVQGMFLLSAPFWCWLILKNGTAKHFFVRTATIAFIPLVFVVIAWFTPVIHDSFAAYFESRFGKTFSGETAHTSNRFHILYELFLDTLPCLLFVGIALLFRKPQDSLKEHFKQNSRLLWFILACAFSGILPLMVTLEQRGFYLATALPLIALAFALSVVPIAQRISRSVVETRAKQIGFFSLAMACALCVVLVSFVQTGKIKTHADQIILLRQVAAVTGENVVIGVSEGPLNDWTLIAYAQRYHHISFDWKDHPNDGWILLEKGMPAPPNTVQIPLNSPLFDLYRK